MLNITIKAITFFKLPHNLFLERGTWAQTSTKFSTNEMQQVDVIF